MFARRQFIVHCEIKANAMKHLSKALERKIWSVFCYVDFENSRWMRYFNDWTYKNKQKLSNSVSASVLFEYYHSLGIIALKYSIYHSWLVDRIWEILTKFNVNLVHIYHQWNMIFKCS